MEKVINNNKLGKIFMYIASIFLIAASVASLILLLIERIPDILLIFDAGTTSGAGTSATLYIELFEILIPIACVLVQLILSIVCIVKNKKHGSIKIAPTLSHISSLFLTMYFLIIVYKMSTSMIGANISSATDIFSLFNFVALILPFLFSTVCSFLFTKIKRNAKKNRSPILNKILSVVLFMVVIIFLLVEKNACIDALGAGTFAKIIFILNLISLFLFLIEGIVSIVYLIVNRSSLHTNINENLECELVKEDANYKLEKRYIERGKKSILPLILSIIFTCLISITLIWELISYIPKVSNAFELANVLTGNEKLSATIIALYRSIMAFLLIGLISYFAYSATYFILGKKDKFYKLNTFLIFQGLFTLFAHLIPIVYEAIELIGFVMGEPIILLPIISTVIFAILSIVSSVLSLKANKQMKNGVRSPELMKSLSISNTLVIIATVLMFIVACILTLSLQYIPAFIGVILLCIILWLQIKNPREEYFLVKTEIQQEILTDEPKIENQNA